MKKLSTILAALVVSASGVFAAEPIFTLEKLWETTDIPANVDSKQGVGYNDVIYAQDKTNSKIWAIAQTGKTEFASSGAGQGMAIDDAGNMIVRDAYFAAATPASFLIYKKGETTGKQVTFTLTNAGRCDFNSASGDIFSTDGGYVYFYCNTQTTISYVKITNGAATADDVTVGTIGTEWTIGTTISHVICDINGNIVAQPRSAAWKKWDVTTQAFVTFTLPDVKLSTVGGCTFSLGGKEFWAYNVGSTNYNSEWNLYNMTDAKFLSDTTLYVKDKTTQNSAYANWLNAQKIDENTVNIYQFCPGVGAAAWKVTYKNGATGVEDINANAVEVKKIVRDGQVLIIRDGRTYNMMGQVVE